MEAPWRTPEAAGVIVTCSGAVVREGGNRAFYAPSTDSIQMPPRGAFRSAESWAATMVHELGHWTGHPSRLNRDLSGRFGSAAYAMEELRAELASAFVGAELGIPAALTQEEEMNDGQAMLEEMQTALRERQQQEFQALIDLYGGLDGWHDACRARRAADPDYRLARIIVRLLRAGGDRGPLRCRPGDRDRLGDDPELEAFWQSVAHAGPDGWREERQRVMAAERQASASDGPGTRLLMLDIHAVKSLLPIYRAWGRMLLDASETPQTT